MCPEAEKQTKYYITTDQKVGGSSPSKRTKTPQDLTSRGVFTLSAFRGTV
jgi:hypothetical protein